MIFVCSPVYARGVRSEKIVGDGGGRLPREPRHGALRGIRAVYDDVRGGARGINLQKRLYAFNENQAAVARRKYSDKMREVKVKAEGFRKLGLYPRGLIYLAKPLAVGLIPPRLLARIKDRVFGRRK